MTEIAARDFIHPALDGFPLSMRLTSASRPGSAVMISSGTGFPKGFYNRAARRLAERGAAVLTYDYRGVGGSRPEDLAAMRMDYPDWGRFDMPAAAGALRAEIVKAGAPDLPILHLAHSVGGHFVGFMPDPGVIAQHAFVSVGTGYWGRHHRSYNPAELFFWLGFGPWSLKRHGYVKGGGLWAGTDLPRGVFETWKRWCLKPGYFSEELEGPLRPHAFEAVTAPIRSWIFTDDPIATPRTARDLLGVYPHAPSKIIVRRPSAFGVRRIGHEGAFRAGMETLWDEIHDGLVAG